MKQQYLRSQILSRDIYQKLTTNIYPISRTPIVFKQCYCIVPIENFIVTIWQGGFIYFHVQWAEII